MAKTQTRALRDINPLLELHEVDHNDGGGGGDVPIDGADAIPHVDFPDAQNDHAIVRAAGGGAADQAGARNPILPAARASPERHPSPGRGIVHLDEPAPLETSV